ncbi:MAG: thiamine pyrophosphate-dependent enzyme [Promethearchaeota archaeon]
MSNFTIQDVKTDEPITWCPGCGNFGILRALQTALVELKIPRQKYLIVTGIGCHGKLFNYVNANGIHTIHGRVLPVATGAKLANHDLIVLGFAGDGDQYDEGLEHLPHAARRNNDIKLFTHDNKVFGLTTGQTSPTSQQGYKSKTSPHGAIPTPINPLLLALASDASFVARGWVGDVTHLKELMKAAIKHNGFTLVDILQVCFTFNKVNTYQFYRERVYNLAETNHDPSDFHQAVKRSMEWGDKIPIGIFYKKERPTYRAALPQLQDQPLIRQPLQATGFEKLIYEFM